VPGKQWQIVLYARALEQTRETVLGNSGGGGGPRPHTGCAGELRSRPGGRTSAGAETGRFIFEGRRRRNGTRPVPALPGPASP